MSFHTKFFNLGTSDSYPESENKKTRLVNKIALSLSILGAPYFFVFYSFGYTSLAWSLLGIIGLYGLCIVLNVYNFIYAARIMTVFVPSLAILIYSSALGHQSGIYFILFAIMTLPFLVFHYKHRVLIILTELFPILSLLLIHLFPKLVSTPIQLAPFILEFLYYTSNITTMVIIIYILYSNSQETHAFESALESSNTQLSNTNKQLQSAYDELKQSKFTAEELAKQSAYATLTRGIAHEIKNPLQMIYGRADLVLDNLENKESVKKFAEVIIRNVERLTKLINSMLEYGSTFNKEKSTFSIHKLLDDIIELANHRCKEKHLSIQSNYSEALDCYGNKVFLYQAILNMVANSIQYTEPSGSITISTEPTTYITPGEVSVSGVKISIKDTGIGIPKDNLSKIFKPYYTSKNKPQNIGLGLSISFKIIAENDGSITIDSTQGIGTTVNICLPSSKPNKS